MLRRLGRPDEMREAFRHALPHAENEQGRRFIDSDWGLSRPRSPRLLVSGPGSKRISTARKTSQATLRQAGLRPRQIATYLPRLYRAAGCLLKLSRFGGFR
jgi:hypothetical protein